MLGIGGSRLFQFYKSAIKRADLMLDFFLDGSFNSTKVRLKVETGKPQLKIVVFQFYKSAIKSYLQATS